MRNRRRPLEELVAAGPLSPAAGPLPLVYRPLAAGVDLAAWALETRASLEAALLEHGALLFRGFGIDAPERFERAAAAIAGPLDPEYPELPRASLDRLHYRPTPYPAEEAIPFHNEGAHRRRWPLRQAFACVRPAARGGETPLADGRRVRAELPPDLARALEERGLLYARSFVAGLDVSWREFTGAADEAALEALCAAAGMELERRAHGPRITWCRNAFERHPATGESLPFHQLLTHHPATLPARLRRDLEGGALPEPPRDARWGDGAPISDEDVARIEAAYRRASVAFAWEAGDLVVLDNVRVAHARAPYEGERSLLVGLSGTGSAGVT